MTAVYSSEAQAKVKVAIALATYNPEPHFFTEQIQSLIDQTFTNWICYISDDQSHQSSFDFMRTLISKDSRFVLIRNETPKGLVFNFENALKNMVGQSHFVAFCDQDDIWEKNKLEEFLKHFDQPSVQVVHSDLSLMNTDGARIADSCWKSESRDLTATDLASLFIRNKVTGCAMMFRSELLEYALPFPSQPLPAYYYHDHWIALHGLLHGQIKEIYQPLTRYRQHGGNVIGAETQKKKNILMKVLNIPFLIQKSKLAYKQRDTLYRHLIKRNPEAKKNLGFWENNFWIFLKTILKKALSTPKIQPLALQLLIGYFMRKDLSSSAKGQEYL